MFVIAQKIQTRKDLLVRALTLFLWSCLVKVARSGCPYMSYFTLVLPDLFLGVTWKRNLL